MFALLVGTFNRLVRSILHLMSFEDSQAGKEQYHGDFAGLSVHAKHHGLSEDDCWEFRVGLSDSDGYLFEITVYHEAFVKLLLHVIKDTGHGYIHRSDSGNIAIISKVEQKAMRVYRSLSGIDNLADVTLKRMHAQFMATHELKYDPSLRINIWQKVSADDESIAQDE